VKRISKQYLQERVVELNRLLARPTTMFASKVGEPTVFNERHIALDKNVFGYVLEEQAGWRGLSLPLTNRHTAPKMNLYLSAMITAVRLTKS
jgi:hypothetical protein